jgi:hypothetical protein
MKEWKLLVLLEYKWRVFRLHQKILYWLVENNMKLTSPILCFLAKRLDKYGILISRLKYIFETQTGVKLVFYKCDKY